ncbi:MAG: ferritin-like domain-containing protein [Gammaproteobacteria bacterium]
MKNIFELAACCLQSRDVETKLQVTFEAGALLRGGQLDYGSAGPPESIALTAFPEKPELLDPRDMPRRQFTTVEGKRAFFHAVGHIEFMAIHLAWDILYRFRGMPERYYREWLRVAEEEAQHFSLIRRHLIGMGMDYGDLPAHSGLWDVAVDTGDDLTARLALVPRYLEARGLDVTPAMIERFRAQNDRRSMEILTRILEDEVGHVQLGSRWFQYVCDCQKVDSEERYKMLISERLKGRRRGSLNRPLRKAAGFSDRELDWLEAH